MSACDYCNGTGEIPQPPHNYPTECRCCHGTGKEPPPSADLDLSQFKGKLHVGAHCVSRREPNDSRDKHYPLFDEQNGCIAHVFKKEHAETFAAVPSLIAEVKRLREENVGLKRKLRTAMQTIDELNQAYIDQNI